MQENKENWSIDRSMVKDKNKTEREPGVDSWKKNEEERDHNFKFVQNSQRIRFHRNSWNIT